MHRCTRKNCSDFCVWIPFTRKIFCAVDRNIDILYQKRSLDFSREQSFATSQTLEPRGFIALRRDDSRLDSRVRSRYLNCFFNQPGLRTCQLTAARAQDDFCCHRRNVACDGGQGKRSGPYGYDARSELSATGGCSVFCTTRPGSHEIFSRKSETCSAMIASAEAIC